MKFHEPLSVPGFFGPVLWFFGLYFAVLAVYAQPLESTFTYQGQLQQNGVNVNGTFDFEFQLFDVDAGGLAILPSPLFLDEVNVRDGLFTVDLDFGFSPFAGDRLWLGIAVRDSTSQGGYTGLLPRQELTPVPYALHSESVAMGAVGSTEVDRTQVQLRISDSCSTGSYVQAIDSEGSVTCIPDQDTVYAAGSGLSLEGSVFSADPEQLQNRVSASCPAGSAIRSIEADGSVSCEADDDTTYAAGSGLTLEDQNFVVDQAVVQSRVTDTCPQGVAIRAIAADGSVTCESPIQNRIVVAKSGGDFTTITAAVSSISDASETNRYQIYVGPGVYVESVLMTAFVDLVGSGRNTTRIVHGGSGVNYTVRAADQSEIRAMTIENDGSGANSFALAVSANGVDFRLTNVAVVTAGSSFNYAVYLSGSAQATLKDVLVTADGGSAAIALYLLSSGAEVFNSSFTATDDANAQGIYTSGGSSGARVVDSIIRADTTLVRFAGDVFIANSELSGNGSLDNAFGSIVCINSRDGDFLPLTSSCVP